MFPKGPCIQGGVAGSGRTLRRWNLASRGPSSSHWKVTPKGLVVCPVIKGLVVLLSCAVIMPRSTGESCVVGPSDHGLEPLSVSYNNPFL